MPNPICPHCQITFEPRARYCANCGRPLESSPALPAAPPVNPQKPPNHTVPKTLAWLAVSGLVLCVLGVGCAAIFSISIAFLKEQAGPVSAIDPADTVRPTLTADPRHADDPPTIPAEPANPEPTSVLPGEPTASTAPSPTPRPAGRPYVGELAPEFTLPDANSSEPVTLSSFTGKPVIVHFWATWCGYCEEEFSLLQDALEARRAAGLVILAIDYEDRREDVIEYGQAHNLTFPLLLDKDGHITDDTYRVDGFPTSFFIYPDGTISFIQIGTMTREELEEQLDQIMVP